MIDISSYINKLNNSTYGGISNINVATEDLKAILSSVIDEHCKSMGYNYLWLTDSRVILENFIKEESKEVERVLVSRLDKEYDKFINKGIKEYCRGY